MRKYQLPPPKKNRFRLALSSGFCYTLAVGLFGVFLQLCGFFRSGGLNRRRHEKGVYELPRLC